MRRKIKQSIYYITVPDLSVKICRTCIPFQCLLGCHTCTLSFWLSTRRGYTPSLSRVIRITVPCSDVTAIVFCVSVLACISLISLHRFNVLAQYHIIHFFGRQPGVGRIQAVCDVIAAKTLDAKRNDLLVTTSRDLLSTYTVYHHFSLYA